MTYRDEREALTARVADLEARLARSQAEVAALTGATDTRAPLDEALGPPSSFGTPTSLTLGAMVGHGITSAGYEAIAALVERDLGVRAQQVGRTLIAPGVLRLEPRGDGLAVTLTRDWRALAPAGWLGTALASVAAPPLVLVGGLVIYKTIAALLGDVHPPNPSDAIVAGTMLGVAPLAATAVNLWARASSRRRVARETEGLARTLAAIREVASRHPDAPPRARVDVGLADEREALDDQRSSSAERHAR